MQVEKYLREHQQIAYKTFQHAITENKLSHAYLLVGNKGAPLLDVAKFLAKSLLCDDAHPFACNNCITCMRIDDNNYPDLLVFDGEKSTIGKGIVSEIELQFNKTAFEKKGIKIYILNCIEYMTEEAINSVLKFLEEPEDNVYAFLTTRNEYAILPTILSRCQTIKLKPLDRKEAINDAVNLGVTQEDAELLSYFYNNGELIFDTLSDKQMKDFFTKSKEALVGLLNKIVNSSKSEIIYYVETSVIPLINKKESFRFFLDLLTSVFEDLINIQNNREITLSSYDKILRDVISANSINVEASLLKVLKERNLISTNLNIPLQMDSIIQTIIKE